MSELFVRSPTQAVDIYGLDGTTVARSKNMFYVRFRRADMGQPDNEWQNNLGFIVKSVDRPSVNPTVEEVNQYNKKRLVTTGYKIQPMRMVLYDTIDNVAMRMWDEYARYYYGDFNQDDDSSYRYDATLADMVDNGSGYGFVPRPDQINNDAQFFFDALEVYQVFGGQFTQFDLINPRISQFDPDELDYSISEPATISITLTYEAIKYRNNGRPTAIEDSELISSVFQGKFNGGVVEIDGVMPRYAKPAQGSTQQRYTRAESAGYQTTALRPTPGQSVGGGALGMFGNYNFGSVDALTQNQYTQSAIQGDVSYISTTDSRIASSKSIGGQVSGTAVGISPNQIDVLSGAVESSGQTTQYSDQYVRETVLPGVLVSATSNNTTLADEVKKTGSGLGLNKKALGVINAQRPATSQIGYNAETTRKE